MRVLPTSLALICPHSFPKGVQYTLNGTKTQQTLATGSHPCPVEKDPLVRTPTQTGHGMYLWNPNSYR